MNVSVRVTVSARVSVSVNVCRGSFKCAWFRADSHRSVEVDVARARPRRREVRTGLGTTPLVCGFAWAGQWKRHFRPLFGTSSGEHALNVNVNVH